MNFITLITDLALLHAAVFANVRSVLYREKKAMKHRKRIHFAFDNLGIEKEVRHGIENGECQGKPEPEKIGCVIVCMAVVSRSEQMT